MAGASSCTGPSLGSRELLQEPAGAKDIMKGCIWVVTGVTTVAWDSYSQGALTALKNRHKTRASHRIFEHQGAPPRTGDAPVTLSAVDGAGQRLSLLQY